MIQDINHYAGSCLSLPTTDAGTKPCFAVNSNMFMSIRRQFCVTSVLLQVYRHANTCSLEYDLSEWEQLSLREWAALCLSAGMLTSSRWIPHADARLTGDSRVTMVTKVTWVSQPSHFCTQKRTRY